MEHLPWEGFVFYDLIFPLFVFIVGIVLPMSLEQLRGPTPSAAYPRILRRFVAAAAARLDSTGACCSSTSPRCAGRACCSGSPSATCSRRIAVLHLQARGQAILAAALLLGYWALLAFVPAPGFRRLRPLAGGQPRRLRRPAAPAGQVLLLSASATTRACSRTSPRSRRACSARSPAGGSSQPRPAMQKLQGLVVGGRREPGRRLGVGAAVPDHQEPVDQLVRADRRRAGACCSWRPSTS